MFRLFHAAVSAAETAEVNSPRAASSEEVYEVRMFDRRSKNDWLMTQAKVREGTADAGPLVTDKQTDSKRQRRAEWNLEARTGQKEESHENM